MKWCLQNSLQDEMGNGEGIINVAVIIIVWAEVSVLQKPSERFVMKSNFQKLEKLPKKKKKSY